MNLQEAMLLAILRRIEESPREFSPECIRASLWYSRAKGDWDAFFFTHGRKGDNGVTYVTAIVGSEMYKTIDSLHLAYSEARKEFAKTCTENE